MIICNRCGIRVATAAPGRIEVADYAPEICMECAKNGEVITALGTLVAMDVGETVVRDTIICQHCKKLEAQLCSRCALRLITDAEEKATQEAHWHSDTPAMLLFQATIGANDKRFDLLLTLLKTAQRWEVLSDFSSSGRPGWTKCTVTLESIVSNLLYSIIAKLVNDLTYWECVMDDLYEVRIVNCKPQMMISAEFDRLLLDEASTREQADHEIEEWWARLEANGALPEDWYREKAGK